MHPITFDSQTLRRHLLVHKIADLHDLRQIFGGRPLSPSSANSTVFNTSPATPIVAASTRFPKSPASMSWDSGLTMMSGSPAVELSSIRSSRGSTSPFKVGSPMNSPNNSTSRFRTLFAIWFYRADCAEVLSPDASSIRLPPQGRPKTRSEFAARPTPLRWR